MLSNRQKYILATIGPEVYDIARAMKASIMTVGDNEGVRILTEDIRYEINTMMKTLSVIKHYSFVEIFKGDRAELDLAVKLFERLEIRGYRVIRQANVNDPEEFDIYDYMIWEDFLREDMI